MNDFPRCAICGTFATADLTTSGTIPGRRCEDCLHETLAIRRVIVGLMGSSKDRIAREMVQYIDHCMGTVELPPDRAALLLRLQAALESA